MVMVYVFCTLSDTALYLYHVLRKYLQQFISYRADMSSILKITKGNNFKINVGGVMILILCSSFNDDLC